MLDLLDLRLRLLLCQFLMNMSRNNRLRLLNRHRVTVLIDRLVSMIAVPCVRRQVIVVAIAVASFLHLFWIVAPRGCVLMLRLLLWLLLLLLLLRRRNLQRTRSICSWQRVGLHLIRTGRWLIVSWHLKQNQMVNKLQETANVQLTVGVG